MRKSLFRLFILGAGLLITSSAWAASPWAESYRLEALAQYQPAIDVLEPLIRQEPRNDFAMLRRGWLHYLKGEYNQAIKDYQTALEINPKSLDARLGLTLPLLAQQRWREATAHADRVLQTAPWNYYAHLRKMVAEEGEKQWQALAKHAAAVAERYPSDANALVYLARANLWLGHKDAAGKAYRKVLERIPDHVEALQFLASGG